MFCVLCRDRRDTYIALTSSYLFTPESQHHSHLFDMSEGGTSNGSGGDNNVDLTAPLEKWLTEFETEGNPDASTRDVRSSPPSDFNRPPSNAPTGPRRRSRHNSTGQAPPPGGSRYILIGDRKLKMWTSTINGQSVTSYNNPDTNIHHVSFGDIDMEIPGAACGYRRNKFLNSVTLKGGESHWSACLDGQSEEARRAEEQRIGDLLHAYRETFMGLSKQGRSYGGRGKAGKYRQQSGRHGR